MTKEEIIKRLLNISEHAVYQTGELPYVMSLDDGIALKLAADIVSQSDDWHTENPPDKIGQYLVQYVGGGMDILLWTNRNPIWPEEITDYHWLGFACEVVAWRRLPDEYNGR